MQTQDNTTMCYRRGKPKYSL